MCSGEKMSLSEPITREKIDQLLAFLPAFKQPGRKFFKTWVGGEDEASGTLIFPYPIYEDDVLEFFRLAGKTCWSDFGYNPSQAGAMLQDLNQIRNADLETIKTMLTFCVRGERFCDGHWIAMLEEGIIVAILERLVELRDTL